MNESGCPLCTELKEDEHILKRWDNFVIILNRYPYMSGHIMVVALNHVSRLEELSPALRAELIEAITDAQLILQKALGLSSTNIGINHGVESGASIPEHLHVHIVPRYINDIGFYHLFTKTAPQRDSARELYRKIRQAFQ